VTCQRVRLDGGRTAVRHVGLHADDLAGYHVGLDRNRALDRRIGLHGRVGVHQRDRLRKRV